MISAHKQYSPSPGRFVAIHRLKGNGKQEHFFAGNRLFVSRRIIFLDGEQGIRSLQTGQFGLAVYACVADIVRQHNL